jgi:hypothetical protein
MLGGANTDSFAVGSINGFQRRPIDNGGWLQPAPAPGQPQPARTIAGVFSLSW